MTLATAPPTVHISCLAVGEAHLKAQNDMDKMDTMQTLRANNACRKAPLAFTLIETLVVLVVIAVLAAVLFPVLANAREKGRAAACQSNYHQIGLAIHMYAQDSDDNTPPDGSSFSGLIDDCKPYTHSSRIFVCPDDYDFAKEGRAGSYRMLDLYQGKSLSCGWPDPYHPGQLTRPTTAILAYEAEHDLNKDHPVPVEPTYRHSGGTQYLLFDGHIRWIKGTSVDKDD